MKQLTKIFIFAILTFSFFDCNKDEGTTRDFPELETLKVSDISANGAKFNAQISNRGNSTVISYGFVWSETLNPSLSGSDKIVYSGNIESNKFSATISTTLKEGVIYHVRSFVITEKYTVYGDDVTFLSLGSKSPEFISFLPLKGTWGDTVRIKGRNFSYVAEKNSVLFGELAAKIISANDTLLTTLVPEAKNIDEAVNLRVSVVGNSSVSQELFRYLIPKITMIQPIEGTFGDTLTIKGENFTGQMKYNSVRFDDINAIIVSLSNTEIRFLVPEKLEILSSQITLQSVGYEIQFPKPFTLNLPVINSVSPDTIFRPNEEITIMGDNFSPIANNNNVQVDGYDAKIIESTKKYIKLILPDPIIPYYNISTFKKIFLTLTIANQNIGPTQILDVHWRSTWTRKNDFFGIPRHNAVAFAINGKGYFGTGGNEQGSSDMVLNDFWEYDPTTDSWTMVSDFPGGAREAAVAFTIGDQAYVGLGSEHYYWTSQDQDSNHFKDFYRYSPATDTWTRIADFGGVGRHSAAAFAINNRGYVGTGWWGNDKPYGDLKIADDFWSYDPSTDTWSEIGKFPRQTSNAVGFNIGNSGYVYDYDSLYRYENNNWLPIDAPELNAYENIAFSIGDLAYFGLGNPHESGGSNELWEYNPITGESSNRNLNPDSQRWGASVFVINNKAYIIGGISRDIDLHEVWELDPTLPTE